MIGFRSEKRRAMNKKHLLHRAAASALVLSAAIVLAVFVPTATSSQTTEYGEAGTNERRPPGRIMDAIGLKPGMVIGEMGAGRGRLTVHLAARVGPTGKVYANDIDAGGLAYIRERCERDGIANVETILGRVDDPLFPRDALDLVFMVLTYHHLSRPVDMLKNIALGLKAGATVVVVDPDPVKDSDRRGNESTSREEIERDAAAAGFEIAGHETFLRRDNIFILKLKESPNIVRLTILYDNTVADASCAGDWGFAALITGYEKTILFDAGAKADLFLANASRLKVDFGAVDVVVISHDHGDHTIGLPAALPKMRDPLILLPIPAASMRSISIPPGRKSECRESSSPICPGARLTGIVGTNIREQGLILETPQGIVLITGCAHPGIVAMIEKANHHDFSSPANQEKSPPTPLLKRGEMGDFQGKTDLGRPIDIVLGGFHLMNHTEAQVNAIIARFRELGVKKVGATHCTGEAAIGLFRKAFGPDFIELGAGRTIPFGASRS